MEYAIDVEPLGADASTDVSAVGATAGREVSEAESFIA
jgi:hypothetical protein